MVEAKCGLGKVGACRRECVCAQVHELCFNGKFVTCCLKVACDAELSGGSGRVWDIAPVPCCVCETHVLPCPSLILLIASLTGIDVMCFPCPC